MQQRTSSSSSRDSGDCRAINAAEQLRPKPALAINSDKLKVHLNVNGNRENISKEDRLSLDVKNLSLNEENGEANKSQTKFTFHELADATGNFKSKCYIGEGGFGKVYKGQLGNRVVAVKKLDRNGLGIREFDVELSTLSLADHPNIVKLIGFCAEGEKRLLVYEYMPLGSLEKHLHDLPPRRKPLDWNTRMKIAAGAARGLEYLHHTMKPPVIYRDLKSSNILLSEGYEAKLSDFGLAVGPSDDKTHVSTRVMGTYGYCDPEYAMTGHLKFQSDIYSFGVLLLELITGRKPIDHTKSAREQNLVAWAKTYIKRSEEFSETVDPLLQGHYPLLGLYQALSVAVMCVQSKPDLRPAISDVVIALDYIASQKYYPQIHHSVQNSRRSPSSPPAVQRSEE